MPYVLRQVRNVLCADTDALTRLRAGERVSRVADDYGLEWQTVQLAVRDQRSIPREVVQFAFTLPRPTQGDKSLGEAALSSGDKTIVTVTRVLDGDMSTMSEAEVQAVKSELENRSSQMDFAALYQTLKDEASIKRPN